MSVDSSDLSTASLVTAMRDGRDDAWIRMTYLYGPLVHKWIGRSGLQTHDAADVSQEVFSAAATSIGSYQHSPEKHGSFQNWLFGITRNKIRQFFKSAASQPSLVSDAVITQIWDPKSLVDNSTGDLVMDVETGVSHEAAAIVREKTLPHNWQAFWRTAVNGERPVDVARDLKLKPSAVREAARRTRDRIQQEIILIENQK